VEVDLDAIEANVRHLRALVAPADLCVVVKADAYGHGDVPVAEAVVEAGADLLAVAITEEGARLREAGIEAPILLLYEPPARDAGEVVRWRLTPTVYRSELVGLLAGSGIDVHLAVDTGMHRAGVDPADAVGLARAILDAGLRLVGTWTHLAAAETDPAFTAEQLARFAAVLEDLAAAGIDPGTRHAANTPGALAHPAARLDLVRIGLAAYGLSPDPSHPDPGLRPAMSVVSEVSFTRRLAAGERPSYGRVRPLPGDAVVATVPIGYADGYPRGLGAGFDVLVGGRRHPLAGTVTMDQVLVDMGDAEVSVGDEVVLLGRQGYAEVTADEWAAALGTISYEVVSRLGARLPRRYVRGGVGDGR
jgi:alanine racemase